MVQEAPPKPLRKNTHGRARVAVAAPIAQLVTHVCVHLSIELLFMYSLLHAAIAEGGNEGVGRGTADGEQRRI